MKQERSSRETPVSTDFEFSVTNYSMMSADELFFKGRLLPFKDNGSNQMQRTIRDELLVDDDQDDEVSPRPPKGSTRWKGLLGLKRSHIGSKKVDKSEGSMERSVGESRRSGFVHEEVQHSKSSQVRIYIYKKTSLQLTIFVFHFKILMNLEIDQAIYYYI